MLGNVGDPELIGCGTGELALHEVGGRRDLMDVLAAGVPDYPFDPRTAHEHLDGGVSDADALSQGELGMHPAVPIGPSRGGVYLGDHVGQPDMANRASRWCSAAPVEVR